MESESKHPEEETGKEHLFFRSKKEQRESSLNLSEILLRLVEKLKEELFILSVVFCILVAVTVVFSGQFPLWAAFTFIIIYLIAAACYMYPKTIDVKKEIRDETSRVLYTKWSIHAPKAFQDPFQVAI